MVVVVVIAVARDSRLIIDNDISMNSVLSGYHFQ